MYYLPILPEFVHSLTALEKNNKKFIESLKNPLYNWTLFNFQPRRPFPVCAGKDECPGKKVKNFLLARVLNLRFVWKGHYAV